MKIIKFLHASNFQLHTPVTCWMQPSRTRAFSVSGQCAGEGLSGGKGDSVSSSFSDTVSDSQGFDPISSTSDLADLGTSASEPETSGAGKDVFEDGLMFESTASPLFGGVFPELSASIREECLQAVWTSAARVFELAIAQNVDFVLLTGNILQPDLCGARGIAFLAGQFRRLQERGIPVYWKLERSLEEWILPDFRFPENVFLFPSNQAHIKKFRLPDSPKNIFIASWQSERPDFSHYDFSRLPDGKLPPFQTIAICPDERTFCGKDAFSAERSVFVEGGPSVSSEISDGTGNVSGQQSVSGQLSISGLQVSEPRTVFSASVCEVPYAALTGTQERFTVQYSYESGKRVFLHSPGPIQYHELPTGKDGKEPSPAGVTVVQMDLDGDVPVSLQFFPTETIGWRILEKRIPGEVTNRESLARWMKETLRKEFSRKTEPARPESSAEDQTSANAVSADGSGTARSTECERVFVFWKLASGKPAHGEMLRLLLEESVEHDAVSGAVSGAVSDAVSGAVSGAVSDAVSDAVSGAGSDAAQRENASLSDFLFSELRPAGETLPGSPWTVSITPVRTGLIPFSWSQAETMLGDLLRLAQFHLMNPTGQTRHPDFASHSLDLFELLAEEQRATLLREMVQVPPEDEIRILEAASILGASALAQAQEERNR